MVVTVQSEYQGLESPVVGPERRRADVGPSAREVVVVRGQLQKFNYRWSRPNKRLRLIVAMLLLPNWVPPDDDAQRHLNSCCGR